MSNANNSLIEPFIARWHGREGGAERANYGMFLSELCDVLGVPRPHPAAATTEHNDYVFERAVRETTDDGRTTTKRIDLYKRGCFVLEAKQSRQSGGAKEVDLTPDLFGATAPRTTRARASRAAASGFDVLMLNARKQAEAYARDLPVDHGWPPFVLVCDVGNIIETYADFSGQGKNYAQFPDRRGFRIALDQLRDPAILDRLRRIWTDPHSLDPARHAARVTRDIAQRLAAVSRALEVQHDREMVALFLMRCLFTMFAEDCGLLPADAFKTILRRCEDDPDMLAHLVGELWRAMDTGAVSVAISAKVKRFNGEFFKDQTVLPLDRAAIGELRRAAEHDWREVDPSIFGTLLEQALDPQERKSLGAHYTPRAYVERLVNATVIEPLRQDWAEVLATAERQSTGGRGEAAIATVSAFAQKLCGIRVLDPACGTGNFLYVSLELLKRLEGEVLDALVNLGGQEALGGLASYTVDPHQFLGLEANPRAAGIAELVLWIGHLQWHFRTHSGMPGEPILKAFHNIEVRDAVLDPKTGRPPVWPAAEFIVGNPPFIGGKDVRARLGDEYAEALWHAHPAMNDSADLVMYWWDHAADLLVAKGSVLRRFGFVATNSITQTFSRRCIERHLTGKAPISIIMAIADHPWTEATPDAAAVRIAMTVARAGRHEGVVYSVTYEAALDTDAPEIILASRTGIINADLTIGVDVTLAEPLLANDALCSRGMALHGAGFIVTPAEAEHLGLGRRPGLEHHIRNYRNGRDLTAHPRGVMVIDLFGLSADEVRRQFPEVYQHLLTTVKPERDANNRAAYALNWWIFGEPRKDLRPAFAKLPRYIATVETAKHRIFQFLDASILPDNKLIAIGSADAFHLGVLQSHIHVTWALRAGGLLEDRPVYVKSSCFDPFPFPDCDDAKREAIRAIAEEIDAHRKRVLAEHPHLTLTGLYNVRNLLRTGTDPHDLTEADRRIFEDGLVLILDERHRDLDRAVADSYGWPHDLSDTDILARLVALNRARIAEEARGKVRWLRPDYQIPRLGSPEEKLDLAGGDLRATAGVATVAKRAFPTDEVAQTAEIMAALASSPAGLTATDIALRFKGRTLGPKIDAVLAGLVRLGVVSAAHGSYRLNLAA